MATLPRPRRQAPAPDPIRAVPCRATNFFGGLAMLVPVIADFGQGDLAFAEVVRRIKSLRPDAEPGRDRRRRTVTGVRSALARASGARPAQTERQWAAAWRTAATATSRSWS